MDGAFMLNLLDRPIAYHRCFVAITGSVTAAVMLSQAVYWSRRTNDADGWFYKTQSEWEEETGLTRSEQETARKKLYACGFWEEKRKGIPAQLFFRLNEETLQSQLLSLPQSSMRESCNQASNFPAIKPVTFPQSIIRTETTTENTTGRVDSLSALLCELHGIGERSGWQMRDRFQSLAIELTGLNATIEQVKAFWASRTKSKPALNYFAGDFTTWRAGKYTNNGMAKPEVERRVVV